MSGTKDITSNCKWWVESNSPIIQHASLRWDFTMIFMIIFFCKFGFVILRCSWWSPTYMIAQLGPLARLIDVFRLGGGELCSQYRCRLNHTHRMLLVGFQPTQTTTFPTWRATVTCHSSPKWPQNRKKAIQVKPGYACVVYFNRQYGIGHACMLLDA
jgi:hypothetical protein